MTKFLFKAKDLEGKEVQGQLLTNKLATYIITEKNPHECSEYGYIEIDEYCRVDPESVELINKPI